VLNICTQQHLLNLQRILCTCWNSKSLKLTLLSASSEWHQNVVATKRTCSIRRHIIEKAETSCCLVPRTVTILSKHDESDMLIRAPLYSRQPVIVRQELGDKIVTGSRIIFLTFAKLRDWTFLTFSGVCLLLAEVWTLWVLSIYYYYYYYFFP